jgi:hypothetical protein
MEEIVMLNVGGHKYYTTRTTLLGSVFLASAHSIGNRSGTFFHGLLNGSIPSLKDSKGFYFIDRDGRSFEVILNYLRTGSLHFVASNKEQVQTELLFYMIDLPNHAFPTDRELREIAARRLNAQVTQIVEENPETWKFVQETIQSFREQLERTGTTCSRPFMYLEHVDRYTQNLDASEAKHTARSGNPDVIREYVNKLRNTFSSFPHFGETILTTLISHAKEMYDISLVCTCERNAVPRGNHAALRGFLIDLKLNEITIIFLKWDQTKKGSLF